ncbi:MAG: MBL fold metallo-hydrolase, partial [Proteobacteria bacterium]
MAPLYPLTFDTSFRPAIGAPVVLAPGLIRITAPNASPYTFTGTNSFRIGREKLALLDPGPDDASHL